jgi:hypothetical protein
MLSQQKLASGVQLDNDIQSAMERIEARHSFNLWGNAEGRVRNGEAGFGELTEFRGIARASLPIGYVGRLDFSISPVAVDSASFNITDPLSAGKFGTASVPAGPVADPMISVQGGGTELRLEYRQAGLRVDVGTTPLGFRLKNVVGGLGFRHDFGGIAFGIELGRRVAPDTLLSWGGLTDPISGTTWGGVLRDGGRFDVAFFMPKMAYYLFAGYTFLHGQGVASNRQMLGGCGIDWTTYEFASLTVTTGMSVSAQGYELNLNHFTLGHGGYFSPTTFVHAGVPLGFKGTPADKLKWDLSVEAGINWFREASAPYFPNDPARQSDREQQTDVTGQPLQAWYSEKSSLAFALNLHAGLSYTISDQLDGSLSMDLHRAEDYQEFAINLAVRFGLGNRGKTREPPRGAVPGDPFPAPILSDGKVAQP